MICSPASPDFSGWNCTPKTFPRARPPTRMSPACVAGRDAVGRHGRRVRMGEVHVRARLEAGEDLRAARELQPVPPDMGNFQPLLRVALESHDPSGQHAEARHLGRLVAAFKEPLHPEADPEERRRACAHGRSDRVAPRADERSRRREVADTRHYQRGIPRAFLRRDGRCELSPERRERLAHRREVARAVIDQRDHSESLWCSAASSRAARPARTRRAARGQTP